MANKIISSKQVDQSGGRASLEYTGGKFLIRVFNKKENYELLQKLVANTKKEARRQFTHFLKGAILAKKKSLASADNCYFPARRTRSRW